MINRYLLVITLCILNTFLFSQTDRDHYTKQEDRNFLEYERGFQFKEGIYLNFMEFRKNNPSIITDVEERDGVLYYYNDSAQKMIRFNKAHWGYSSGKNISVFTGYSYSRLAVIGSLCYFAVVYSSGSSPAVGVSTGGGVAMGVSAGNQGSMEYMLDMQTGNLISFNKKNMTRLLEKRDEQLLREYKKKKGRKDAKLHYILNAYNSYHPLYFPVD